MFFFSRPICSRVTDLFSLLAYVQGLSIPQWILTTLLFIVISLLTTATIHATAMTYTRQQHPATASDVILKTRHAWKGSLVTQICITILHLCFVLSTDPVLVGLAIISNDSKLLTLLLVVVSLLAVLYYLYVAMVLLLCLVVSAIEDECYGTEAMGRALELVSRKQGVVVIAVLLVVLSSVATLVFEVLYSARSDGSQLLIGFIHICKDVVLNFLILATSTVLYYECNKCKGEEEFMEMEEGHIVYASLLTDGCLC
ncbi:hypothetical protein B296_00042583 [Ensete ventricosum]|uniref:Uncharacterized protein n=1 Tax=Ensete ventricosum TaxID=4639 RepID=A0A426XTT9_ENSVE|nr:hypothetical protein B296_00042583 [Ensete ventricosum]